MDPQSGPPQSDVLIGQTVGNYLVTQKLGEGGMGSVYLAEHPTIGKKVALKVLHPEFASNPEVADRFFTEAKAVNAIGHPNIVDIVDYGMIQAPGGRDRMVYFIMEFLAGVTLSQVIRAEAPLTPERALTIALQVADALAASHKNGIVHRDLKPDNIILITRGRERDFVKLLDFGIAKLTGTDGMSSHKTKTGLVLGTPAYMSPEQCEGKPNVDHRTDVYALGIVLYEMLTGRVPFIGEGYGEILVQHLTQRPVEPSRYRMMSPHVEQVVMKALEKRPEMRYPTMDEFMRAMSDPVGFVEAHGGIAGFAQRQLMPSSAPLPAMRLTPPPTGIGPSIPTPMPGIMSPVPGTLSPVPTTLGAATGQIAPAGRSKAGFVIGGFLVVAAAAAGVFLVLHGKDKTAPADNGSGTASGSGSGSGENVVTMGSGSSGSAGSEVAIKQPPPPPPATPDAAVAVTPPPEPTNVTVTVTSDPPGAEIFVDGVDVGKQTNASLTLPIHGNPQLRLKLKGYDEFVFKPLQLDKDTTEPLAKLKKTAIAGHGPHPTPPGNGSGSGGKGSGGHGGNDTGLMNPDNM
ncbi:MAG TPA: serine/threonine-protein kinase [Kofleriaceae bacterium]|nr:serine/threonine-protein kinase [Kofleriaceae bacterium]